MALEELPEIREDVLSFSPGSNSHWTLIGKSNARIVERAKIDTYKSSSKKIEVYVLGKSTLNEELNVHFTRNKGQIYIDNRGSLRVLIGTHGESIPISSITSY